MCGAGGQGGRGAKTARRWKAVGGGPVLLANSGFCLDGVFLHCLFKHSCLFIISNAMEMGRNMTCLRCENVYLETHGLFKVG